MYEYANEANIMGNKHATGFCLVVDVHLKTFSHDLKMQFEVDCSAVYWKKLKNLDH